MLPSARIGQGVRAGCLPRLQAPAGSVREIRHRLRRYLGICWRQHSPTLCEYAGAGRTACKRLRPWPRFCRCLLSNFGDRPTSGFLQLALQQTSTRLSALLCLTLLIGSRSGDSPASASRTCSAATTAVLATVRSIST